jgi:signal transduction histidine kinase
MTTRFLWVRLRSWAGAVPIRWKVIGIVITSQLVLGLAIAWWVRTGLGQWLSYLLTEERVALAMQAGMRGVMVVTALAIAGGLVLAWLLTLVLTHPLLNLAALSKRVASGDLTARSPVWADDEVGYLARSFNSMVDALEESRTALMKSNAEVMASNEELRRLYENLRRKEEVRVSLLARTVSAQEEERLRLSRELHDGVGQMLASLLVHLKLIEKSNNVELVREKSAELRTLIVQTLEETKRLSMDLRPAGLDDLGLPDALEWYARAFERNTGIAVRLSITGFSERLPQPVEVQLYRIAQEMLTNISKHAGASQAEMSLRLIDGNASLSVKDDGKGFDAIRTLRDSNRGLGLLTMKERAELLGGSFQLSSAPGQGTAIGIMVPVLMEET